MTMYRMTSRKFLYLVSDRIHVLLIIRHELRLFVHSVVKAPEPRTIMEALEQRHQELTKRGEEAAINGDRSKARRMERLSKVSFIEIVQ